MVTMWDETFSSWDPKISDALNMDDGRTAFERMHVELDKVWHGVFHSLRAGGFACINVGDAVRSIRGEFQLFSNHTRIINGMLAAGFTLLPDILWRKPTNAPNKFMGSGMLPAGAYVTYEHEYILVFRKGKKRLFKTAEEAELRRVSAFFWEERNQWFSDIWSDIKGASQKARDPSTRGRTAAFPNELAYRLICMYSLLGDTVFDPFLGSGTTMAAAIASGRNSIGFEIDASLETAIRSAVRTAVGWGQARTKTRLQEHRAFIDARTKAAKTVKHYNTLLGIPVMTSQETALMLPVPATVDDIGERSFLAKYDTQFGAQVKAAVTQDMLSGVI